MKLSFNPNASLQHFGISGAENSYLTSKASTIAAGKRFRFVPAIPGSVRN